MPVGARFSVPIQTGHKAQTTSCSVGAGSLPGTDHLSPILVLDCELVRAISPPPLCACINML